MKKIIFILLTGFLFFTSCEETESPIYDGQQTLGYFSSLTSTQEIEINQTSTYEIPIAVSTLSSSSRSLNVTAVADETTAPDGTYSFSNATIPANEYFGTVTITVTASGFAQAGADITAIIDSVSDGGVGSSETHRLRLLQVCPIAATFATGMYNVAFVSGGVAAAGNAPALGDGVSVELVAGATSTERIFNVKCYPSFGFTNTPSDFSFNLVCGTTISNGIVEGQVSGVGCGGSISFGPSDSPGSYTIDDDTTITIIFAEDTEEICGGVGTTTYTLTKI